MATWKLDSTAHARWSWLRISGFSGTAFVHIVALLLLAIPVAVPSYRPAPPELSIRWIEAPPEPVVLPVPDEPVLLPRPKSAPVAGATPTVLVDVTAASAIPESVIPASVESIAPTTAPERSLPAGVDNASLAYESVVQPRYPMAAVRRHEEGTVLVRVTVGHDGLPTYAEVARSSGSQALDKAAREAVLRWRFHPVRINGIAVQAKGIVPVEFKLGKF